MKIALVGNQNCGKSMLFNSLTGANQKIGNWPGVTVDIKEGIIKESDHKLIDLPGIYSLSPYTEEEKITRNFILDGDIDLIINVVDVTSIERSLYLTTQLMDLDIPIVVALNMMDLASKKGIEVNSSCLEKELNVEVVEVSALKNIGIKELKESINNINKKETKKIFNGFIEERIEMISKDNLWTDNKRFYSIKILERDELCKDYSDRYNLDIVNMEKVYDGSIDSVLADQRYKFINEVKERCFIYSSNNKESVSDKLDKIFLNKWLALPIFIVIMFLVYYLSVGVVGSFTVDLVDGSVSVFKEKVNAFLNDIEVSGWLISLMVEGIIAGVGAVLNFVPQLIILFLCISLLETSGYMSRIAFFLDMVFKKFGLSGKSLVPFIVGSGCSVPGIMASRTIENRNERELSIILTPFIPCSAKLPIIALFAEFFFPSKTGLVSFSLYFLAIILILTIALIFKKYVYKDESSTFISELPEYKMPSIKHVLKDVFEKVFSFIKRAGSVILIASIAVWFLLSFSFKGEYGVNIENSMLASIGKCFSWFFYPILGELSWEATVSAIQGLVAKEQVVGSMAIIANMGEDSIDSLTLFGGSAFSFFGSVSAYAYVVFNLFSAPCFGAIGAMKKELGSYKKMLFAVMLQLVVAWIIASLVYLIGTLMVGG